jgi:hypothetical protein
MTKTAKAQSAERKVQRADYNTDNPGFQNSILPYFYSRQIGLSANASTFPPIAIGVPTFHSSNIPTFHFSTPNKN